MDWIEEQIEKWKRWFRDSSLWKALAGYLFLAVLLTILAVAATFEICFSWQNVIKQVYRVDKDYLYVGDGAFAIYYDTEGVVKVAEEFVKVDEKDGRLYEVLSAIELCCIPVYSVVAICLVSVVYYRNKLREPIFLLKTEMEYIKRNDLSYSCFYDSRDEMGDICKTMDIMRKAVVDNQKNMWELMEEQRKINAAFAHDLRTPLTVITGYVEMLTEYYPKGQVSEKQLLSTLSSIQSQAVRMKDFSETMKEVHGFEMLEVKKKWHTGQELEEEIRSMAAGLENENTPVITVSVDCPEEKIYYDENVVLEVLGNLLSNAFRYGKCKVEILAEKQEDRLFLYVKDDGRGMTKEELYKADSPYYSDKTKESSEHFGLGLTICKILCKKHGGRIHFSNSVEGGAIVCAEFLV